MTDSILTYRTLFSGRERREVPFRSPVNGADSSGQVPLAGWLAQWIAAFCLVGSFLFIPITRAETNQIKIFDQGVLRTFELELETETAAKSVVPTNGLDQIVLYEKGGNRDLYSRRIVTPEILVRLRAATDASVIGKRVGAAQVEQVAFAPGYFIIRMKSARAALKATEMLRSMTEVESADPLLGKMYRRKFVPNDTLFSRQWHLLNRGQIRGAPGIDLNITNVWERFRGKGVLVGVVDDGIQMSHPDLAENYNSELDFDYRGNDDDPSPGPTDDYHGTAVAGILAARGNNDLGVSGVAFESTLVGIRLIGTPLQTDFKNAAAMLHRSNVVQVSNNSWGADDSGQLLEGPGPLMAAALETAVKTGRNGLGTIFVWSAGNGAGIQDNVNYDGYANSIYTIAVGALNDQGRAAGYSEPGSCLIVSAPADPTRATNGEQITTTDVVGEDGFNFDGMGELENLDYTRTFGGTSAVTPMVSGIIALMLEANPNLGWRDVQEILIKTATRLVPDDEDWQMNGGGFLVNHKMGAGMINAHAAVQAALVWSNLPPQQMISLQETNLAELIPDNLTNGLVRTFDFTMEPGLRLEHVALTVSIAHSRRGDLALTLVSPYGTESRLAERHLDSNDDYSNWKFTSVFHWGESSLGNWQLKVADLRTNQVGQLNAVKIDLYGTPDRRPHLTALASENEDFRLRLTGQIGFTYTVQASTDLSQWEDISTVGPLANGWQELTLPRTMAANYLFFRAFIRSP